MSKDYLTEDSILPEGQNFVCISFLTDPNNKLTLSGIKIRGVFDTIDKASEHAKKIQSVDPAHNVFVGEMGKWLAFDPDATSQAAGNPEYANEQLNDIMKGYLENQEKSKLFHEERKYKNMREGVESAITTTLEKESSIKQELLESKDEVKMEELKKKLSSIEEQMKELNKQKEDISKKEKKIGKKLYKNQGDKDLSV